MSNPTPGNARGRIITGGIEPRIGSWWMFEGAVMWEEKTLKQKAKGFLSKREVKEKCKRYD